VYSLVVDGGSCEEDPADGSVTCSRPSVTFTATPLTCNLLYKEACEVTVRASRVACWMGARRRGLQARPMYVSTAAAPGTCSSRQAALGARCIAASSSNTS
jgi:hypothetical protein